MQTDSHSKAYKAFLGFIHVLGLISEAILLFLKLGSPVLPQFLPLTFYWLSFTLFPNSLLSYNIHLSLSAHFPEDVHFCSLYNICFVPQVPVLTSGARFRAGRITDLQILTSDSVLKYL
jgi:hypothetical protein